jgi:hypothetical protein
MNTNTNTNNKEAASSNKDSASSNKEAEVVYPKLERTDSIYHYGCEEVYTKPLLERTDSIYNYGCEEVYTKPPLERTDSISDYGGEGKASLPTMATTEMTRSEEANHSLKVHQECIDFILHKDEITASFQHQYDDVVHARSNAARLYMDGDGDGTNLAYTEEANDAYVDYLGKRNQLNQEVEKKLYDLDVAVYRFRKANGSDNHTKEFINMITFLERIRLALTCRYQPGCGCGCKCKYEDNNIFL